MIIRRLTAVTGAMVAAGLLPGLPALAHGAPTSPISRTAACAGGGQDTRTAACQAARAANGGPFGAFDNLRVADINGRDRQLIPDGKLCSGGLDAYRGLDLARTDFPATTVTGGTTLRVRYRATIPHPGSFRVYLTRPGYDPTKKLTWADLGTTPLRKVTEPPVVDGSYSFDVRLPSGRSGRHVLYIVWQTTQIDTYYSCSDLVFRPTAAAVASPAPSASTKPAKRHRTASASPVAAPPPVRQLTPVSDQTTTTLGYRILGGALVVALGAIVWAGVARMRRKRLENR